MSRFWEHPATDSLRSSMDKDVDGMRRLAAVLLGVVLGGSAVYGAFHYHLVKTENDLLWVPKPQLSLKDVYVDVRGWGHDEWRRHPELVEAMVEGGHGELIAKPTTEELLLDLLQRFRDARREDGDARQE